MSLTRCPFCEHGNAANAKFCSECGMHLKPCPRCGAVNRVTATVCHQCLGNLPGRSDAPDPFAPAADVPRFSLRRFYPALTAAADASKLLLRRFSADVSKLLLPRFSPALTAAAHVWKRFSLEIVATVVFAAMAIPAYYAYRQDLVMDDIPWTPAAGVVGRSAAPGDAKSTGTGTGLPGPSSLLPENPLAPSARAATDQPRAGRQPIESRKTKAPAVTEHPGAIKAGEAGRPAPYRPEACTEGVAALDLCSPSAAQKKQAETAIAVETAITRPRAIGTGKASSQEASRPLTCTEAVAALGLCGPGVTRRE